jgi:hypothetical protein
MKGISILFFIFTFLVTTGCSFVNNKARTAIQPKNVYQSNHIAELAVGEADDSDVDLVALAGRFKTKLLVASGTGATSQQVLEYLDTGVTVVDLYCHEFFKQVSVSQAHRQFLRAETNQTGGLVSAIMGLADAGSGATGGAGALFSFLDSSIESYDSAYLVSPDLPTVQKLVFQTQSQLAAELTASASVYTYPQAERALAMYASNCTFNGIRSLMNSSLSTTTTTVEKSGTTITGIKTN